MTVEHDRRRRAGFDLRSFEGCWLGLFYCAADLPNLITGPVRN